MHDKKDYKLIKSIGKGAFGEVFLTKKGNSPKLYATKIIPYSNLKTEESKKYLKNEIKIMQQLDHPNIIKLYDIKDKNEHKYLVMDYINGGSLSELFKKYKLLYGAPFPQKMIQFFVKQIVQGLIYIHSKNIIHRDLKLDNILLDYPPNIKIEARDYTQAQVKIIDFGLSTQLQSSRGDLAKSVVGSPIYMDPIILQKYKEAGGINRFKYYDEKADIWSLGALTYEMLTGENLFKARNLPDLINKVDEGNYFLNVKDLSCEVISFLNCMLQYYPEKRLSAKELAKHQFLNKDPENFISANIARIENKLSNGVLTINIFHNRTISNMFPIISLDLGKIHEDDINSEKDEKDIRIINRKDKDTHKVKFEVQRIDNKQENINFSVTFLVNEKDTLYKDVNLKAENAFHNEWIWDFNNNDWKNIDNNNDDFIMTIKFNELKLNEDIKYKVEKIKFGKQISMVFKDFIKFNLIPLVFKK